MVEFQAGPVVPAGEEHRRDQDAVLHHLRARRQREATAGLLGGHAEVQQDIQRNLRRDEQDQQSGDPQTSRVRTGIRDPEGQRPSHHRGQDHQQSDHRGRDGQQPPAHPAEHFPGPRHAAGTDSVDESGHHDHSQHRTSDHGEDHVRHDVAGLEGVGEEGRPEHRSDHHDPQ